MFGLFQKSHRAQKVSVPVVPTTIINMHDPEDERVMELCTDVKHYVEHACQHKAMYVYLVSVEMH